MTTIKERNAYNQGYIKALEIERSRRFGSPAYTLIRRKTGWQITCANCGGYNILASFESMLVEPLHRLLDLHDCGEPAL